MRAKLRMLCIMLAIMPIGVFAQEVKESKVKIGRDHKDGYVAMSRHGSAAIKNVIETKFKNAGLGKRSTKKGFRTYKGAVWPAVSTNKMDVYYRVKGNSRKCKVYLVASKGYDNYITGATDAAASTNIITFLQSLDRQAELDEQIGAKQAELKTLDEKAKEADKQKKEAEESRKQTQKQIRQLQDK